jgi:hypothetical protein
MKGKKFMAVVTTLFIGIIAGYIYYYIALPAINIHSPGFWEFIIFILVVITAVYYLFNTKKGEDSHSSFRNFEFKLHRKSFKDATSRSIFKVLATLTLGVVVVFLIGSLLSSPIINASKYQKLMTVNTRNFTEDIKEISYDKIPILDKESATTIGNRVMGTMVDMVSQFEVSDLYSQINLGGKPVRVSPLQYGSIIKWFANSKAGIPAYIKIDMATQKAECVRLEQRMKYSTSDHFSRYVYRHLRFAYPTYIFDDFNFQVDEEGTPYWICPVKKYNVGLFGGVTIGRVVLCNAITGELQDFPVEDVPQWVDQVYSANTLISLYDYHGTLKHGYFNSVLSQKDCLQTTDGYNYIALDDDVWVYTGVTSVGQDKSNVGFVLMNQRTMETRYYEISGAEENSAMSSAEGKVQHLGYKATFPLLLNVGGEPTYFIALKDSAGLVKSYAMLNIQKYQTVAIGDTVSQCETNYLQMLKDNGIVVEEDKESRTITGTVTKMAQVVIDGNSHYYIMLSNSQALFDVSVADLVDVIRCNPGDTVEFEYTENGNMNTVSSLTIKPSILDK